MINLRVELYDPNSEIAIPVLFPGGVFASLPQISQNIENGEVDGQGINLEYNYIEGSPDGNVLRRWNWYVGKGYNCRVSIMGIVLVDGPIVQDSVDFAGNVGSASVTGKSIGISPFYLRQYCVNWIDRVFNDGEECITVRSFPAGFTERYIWDFAYDGGGFFKLQHSFDYDRLAFIEEIKGNAPEGATVAEYVAFIESEIHRDIVETWEKVKAKDLLLLIATGFDCFVFVVAREVLFCPKYVHDDYLISVDELIPKGIEFEEVDEFESEVPLQLEYELESGYEGCEFLANHVVVDAYISEEFIYEAIFHREILLRCGQQFDSINGRLIIMEWTLIEFIEGVMIYEIRAVKAKT